MSEEQQKMDLPVTEEYQEREGGNYMKKGPHKMKITSIGPWMKGDKEAKDSRGYPGVTIKFENKDGEIMFGYFYYNPHPGDHISRQSDETRCKSEWKLSKLKGALGFDANAKIPFAEASKKAIWGTVKEIQVVDTSGKELKKYHDLTYDFWSGNMKEENLNALIEEKGIKLEEERVDYKATASDQETSHSAQSAGEEGKPSDSEDGW